MSSPLLSCPKCSATLGVARGLKPGRKYRCPRCGAAFAVAAESAGPLASPALPPPLPGPSSSPAPPPGPSPARTAAVVGVLVAVVVALGAGTYGTISWLSQPGPEPRPAPAAGDGPRVEAKDKDTPPGPSTDGPKPPKPVDDFALPEEQQRKVDAAIARGVDYLKKCINDCDGVATAPDLSQQPNLPLAITYPGAMNLAGMTLLASGVPASDPAVQKAANQARSHFPGWTSSCETYDLAVTILFLDQLGDARDEELIQAVALRMIAGQNASGGWAYNCPVLEASVAQALREALTRPGPLDPKAPEILKNYPVLGVEPGKPIALKAGGYFDNSLVQFAVLALWVAQKHGVPAQRSLLMAAQNFRDTQNEDGSWGYRSKGTADWTFNDSMTCAGLISLAVARGAELSIDASKTGAHAALQKDPMIEKALRFVSGTIGKERLPPDAPIPNVQYGNFRGRLVAANAMGDLYYLWSLERMAVIFNLKRVGGKEWYPWGAELLAGSQQADGSWRDRFQGPVDTCFALLFLKRVNVARDLTEKLRVESSK